METKNRNDTKERIKMITQAMCPTCGNPIAVATPDTNTDLLESKTVIKCEQCAHHMEVIVNQDGIQLTSIDEIGVVVKGLRELARMIEDHEVTLIRSRHGNVKIPGRGKQKPSVKVGWKAMEVIYQ
jgi:transcription elongation factor Elf1